MKRQGLDGLLLNRIENVRYSTDFRPVVSMWFQNSYSSFVTAGGDVVVLTVAGDYTRAKHYMPWIGDMRVMHTLGRAEEVSKVFRDRSEEHTSELQSQSNLVCRLLLEKK